MNITEVDKKALRLASSATLAAWWNELNSWGWPAGLPDPEPSSYFAMGDRRWSLMGWIETALEDRGETWLCD